MSSGDIGELMATLKECDLIIGKLETRTQSLRTEAGHAVGDLREVEYILYRTISVLRRMGLPENVETATQVLGRLLITIRMVHAAFMLMESMTPYGWVLAGIGFVSAGITVISLGDTITNATMGR